jgi:hypothetical protein
MENAAFIGAVLIYLQHSAVDSRIFRGGKTRRLRFKRYFLTGNHDFDVVEERRASGDHLEISNPLPPPGLELIELVALGAANQPQARRMLSSGQRDVTRSAA